MACLSKLLHPFAAEAFDGTARLLEVRARVKFLGMLEEVRANGGGHGEAVVSVDVDFPNPCFDCPLDFIHRNAPRLAEPSAMPVDGLKQVLRH